MWTGISLLATSLVALAALALWRRHRRRSPGLDITHALRRPDRVNGHEYPSLANRRARTVPDRQQTVRGIKREQQRLSAEFERVLRAKGLLR